MKTYTVYTVLIRGTDSKWHSWNFHGCFEDAAWAEASELAAKGVPAAIRFDTYRAGRKSAAPVATRFEQVQE